MFNIGSKIEKNYELDEKGVNNLRGLALDMISNSKSGHPGIALGAAGIIYTLYKYHMNIDINNLDFINRDRFILSSGHGSTLIYGIDYFLGLLSLDDLKDYRKLNSKTPGHPDYLKTPLVEMTSGLLGQGIGFSVGIAIAQEYLNKKTDGIIDYYTYVLCGDGELEEGITYESLALAGNLNLNKLIVLVDYNDVTLDNDLKTTSCEDLKMRFESINFNVIEISDSIKDIDEGIEFAKKSDKPSCILIKTTIGKYSKYEGTNIAHSKLFTDEELKDIKEKLGLFESSFTVNKEVIDEFKKEIEIRSKDRVLEFNNKLNNIDNKNIINRLINKEVTYNINNIDISYNEESLKDLSNKILNKISNDFELLIGGSADLSSSCKTYLENSNKFNKDDRLGKNLCFGIREHAMSAILNGLALIGLRPFGSTFLAFSDYMRPGIRMSSMMRLPVLYIFTHDSITVGSDGSTHQPIEQLPSLDLIPNLKVYRPYDLNELLGCYIDIFKNQEPSCLILPRDNKEISSNTKSSKVEEGIYEVISNETDNYINLIGNGEELGIILKVSKNLKELGIDNKVFSIPCRKNITLDIDKLLNNKLTIAITLTCKEYYYEFTKQVIGINEFGISGSKEEVLDYFMFTEEKLTSKILELLKK